jgi:hypothetical protein
MPPPPEPAENKAARVPVQLGTSAPQTIDSRLSISVIQAAVRGRQLSASTAVLNRGRTPYSGIQLRFWIDGGGHQNVRIHELRPGETRNVRVRLRTPRGDHPDMIWASSMGRLASR